MFSEAKIEVEGKQNWDQSFKCFVMPPNSKTEKKIGKKSTPAGSKISRGFKEHDLTACESKVQVVVSLGS